MKKILQLLPWILVNSSEFLNATQSKQCGTFLKSLMKKLLMSREPKKTCIDSGVWFFIMQYVQKWFEHILDHFYWSREVEKEELRIEVLKHLDRKWQHKVISISAKDLPTMSKASFLEGNTSWRWIN